MQHEGAVTILNELIRTSEDGKKGFDEAAHEATKTELKTMFHKRSTDCAAAVVELQHMVTSLGGTPGDSGSVSGAAHRGWAKIKATVGDANLGMLEEAEHAEDRAMGAYAKALASVLPDQARIVVQRQHDGVVANHNLIRDLRKSYKAAPHA